MTGITQNFGVGLYKPSSISDSGLQASKCRTTNNWSNCVSAGQHQVGDRDFLLPSRCCFVRTVELTGWQDSWQPASHLPLKLIYNTKLCLQARL